jgi:hypothetical protein
MWLWTPHADLLAGLDAVGHKALARGGGHVPPVQEGVDVDLLQSLFFGHAQQGVQVGDMAVDASVGQKTHQVQGGALLLAGGHSGEVRRIFRQGAVLGSLGDLRQILKDHPARAHIGVAHLAVADLPLGQTHVQPGGG